MAALTWLHLSDWHQKGKDFDRQVVRNALIKDIHDRAKISPNLAQIDFIVFSGDVAYPGKAEEYKAAVEFLFDPLLKAAGVERGRLFIVPGNHDLDERRFDMLPAETLKSFTSSDQVNKWLTDTEKLQLLLTPFKAYSEFIASYIDKEQTAYAYTCRFEAGGKKIALLGLNSALMCRRHKEVKDGKEQVNDYGHLIVGEPQLHQVLNKGPDGEVWIAVLHHPFSWLTTTDTLTEQSLIRGRLTKACHFILHGHEHEPEVTVPRGTAGECAVISAGSSYDRREPTASRCFCAPGGTKKN